MPVEYQASYPLAIVEWDSPARRFAVDGGFCESQLRGGGPEYGNSFSALYISLIGLFGIFANREIDSLFQLIFSLFFVNGLGSFAYHWTGLFGWGLVDGLSMTLASTFGCHLFLIEYLHQHLVQKSQNREAFHWLSSLVTIGMVSYSIIAICVVTTTDNGSILFTGPLLLILGFSWSMSRNSYRSFLDQDSERSAIRILFTGLTIAILAGLIWIVSENLCGKHEWMQGIYGHVIWHIGESTGLYYILLYLMFVLADNSGHVAKFKYWQGRIPYGIEYRQMERRATSVSRPRTTPRSSEKPTRILKHVSSDHQGQHMNDTNVEVVVDQVLSPVVKVQGGEARTLRVDEETRETAAVQIQYQVRKHMKGKKNVQAQTLSVRTDRKSRQSRQSRASPRASPRGTPRSSVAALEVVDPEPTRPRKKSGLLW